MGLKSNKIKPKMKFKKKFIAIKKITIKKIRTKLEKLKNHRR
jgi:hypothetical protein